MSEPTGAADTHGTEDRLAEVTEDFLRRHRAGERPTVDEYAQKHPDLNDRIRDVFPAILAMEQEIAPLAERTGATIGRYKLLERIGEGGFGVVYMAEQQTPVRRKVALKVIKPGVDTKQVIARFEAERQALALMDHENIAKVLDAGATDSGRPYFVMELVHGVPITEYCDKNKLPPRERLQLFVQVCRAVQHAHTKGIIHRDIKPTNVLVTLHEGVAVPKVIDFGVAKATGQQLTEKTLFTHFAQMVGTPLYMSPEQAEMTGVDVDTRSDVYSLGVLLYELLTGTTPLDKDRLKQAAFDEVRRIIREEEPPRPSTRISTMGEAAQRTISTERHTEPSKLSKLVRGELDWIVMRALEKDRGRRYETANGFARDVERYLRDEPVEACPPSAVYRFRKFARRNKGALLGASAMLAMLLLLVAGLTVSNVRVARERNQKAAALKEKEEALAAAKASAERAEAEQKRAQAERQRAEVNFFKARTAVTSILAKAATGQGAWAQLPPALRKVFSDETALYYQSLIQEGSADRSVRYDTAVGYRSLGFLHSSAKEFEQAEKYYRQSIELLQALLKESASDTEYRHQLAWSDSLLGSTLRATTRPTEAQKAYEDAFELYESVYAQAPNDNKWAELWKCYDALLQIHGASRAGEDVRRTHERAERVCRERVRVAPDDAATHRRLAHVLRLQGKLDESVLAYRRASELDPNDFNAHQNLAVIFLQQGKLDEAAASSRKAVELNPKAAGAYVNLGSALSRQKKFDEAAAAYRKVIELDPQDGTAYGNVGRPRGVSPQVAAYENLAGVLQQQKKLDEAVSVWRELIERDPQLVSAHFGLGRALFDQNKPEEGIAAFKKALAIDPEFAQGQNDIAWLLLTHPDPRVRDPGSALAMAKKAVELEPKNAAHLNTLGVAYYRLGDWKGSIASLEKAMELGQGGDSADWFFLAMARWQLGEKDAAREWYERAVQWMGKKAPRNADLIRFRREAAELLGVSEPKHDAPASAPATANSQPPNN